MPTELALPGLESTDIIVLYDKGEKYNTTDKNENCPLTMEGIGECNPDTFLQDILKTELVNHPELDNERKLLLLRRIKKVKKCSVAEFKECKHSFSAMPLIYNLVTTSFKCPVCRGGSNKVVDIESNKTPNSVDPDIWSLLCEMAKIYRKQDKIEEEQQNRDVMLDLSQQTIVSLRSHVTWTIMFFLESQSSADNRPRENMRNPAAVIGVRLRQCSERDNLDVVFDTGIPIFRISKRYNT